MKRFVMSITVLLFTIPGFFILKQHVRDNFSFYFLFILVLWMCIELYIGIFRTFEDNTPSSHTLIKIPRLIWPVFGLYSWLDFHYSWTKIEFPFWFLILLLLLCFLGLFLRIWAVIYLGKSFSYDVKQPEEGILVRTGPYRFIRHPSYLGICILASIPGLILGSILGFLGMTITTIIQTIIRLRAEEKILENEFGESFLEYKRTTQRFIPYIY